MAATFEEPVRPLRRVEYDRLVTLGAFGDERIELLEGMLVPMSPIGPPHSATLDRLAALLVPPLLGRAVVRLQNPFAAREISEPQPDVAVVPSGEYDADHPHQAHLVIEVAESSLARDRGVKLRLYAQCAVPEYWVVNLEQRCIEVYTDPVDSAYRSFITVPPGHSVRLQRFPDLVIAVDDVVK